MKPFASHISIIAFGLIAASAGFCNIAAAQSIDARGTTALTPTDSSSVFAFDTTSQSFYTPIFAPQSLLTFQFQEGPNIVTEQIPSVSFVITSGFTLVPSSTYVVDNSGIVQSGDSVFADIGSGTFELQDANHNAVLRGSFTAASFQGLINDNGAAVLSVAGTGGLTLSPGTVATPQINFADGTYITSISATTFSIGLPQIDAADPIAIVPGSEIVYGSSGLIGGTLDSFNSTGGSINTASNYTIVPEPSALSLICLGLIPLISRRRRRA